MAIPSPTRLQPQMGLHPQQHPSHWGESQGPAHFCLPGLLGHTGHSDGSYSCKTHQPGHPQRHLLLFTFSFSAAHGLHFSGGPLSRPPFSSPRTSIILWASAPWMGQPQAWLSSCLLGDPQAPWPTLSLRVFPLPTPRCTTFPPVFRADLGFVPASIPPLAHPNPQHPTSHKTLSFPPCLSWLRPPNR